MSSALQALLEAFNEAQALNAQALALLTQGEPLDRLDGLFSAKSVVLERLSRMDLDSLQSPGTDSQLLADALQAQSRCARSETRLAEALGSLRRQQKNVNQVTKAYGAKVVDKLGTKGLDLAS